MHERLSRDTRFKPMPATKCTPKQCSAGATPRGGTTTYERLRQDYRWSQHSWIHRPMSHHCSTRCINTKALDLVGGDGVSPGGVGCFCQPLISDGQKAREPIPETSSLHLPLPPRTTSPQPHHQLKSRAGPAYGTYGTFA